ncbi:hypothetical protein AVEN_56736-1, partial [Araneus ventricosus]
MESERLRDFASRIESLAHKSFNVSDVGASGMSEELREKMLLSEFTAGLKPTVRAQILIENPSKFQEAVEAADRIEKAQNMLTPNINVVSSLTENSGDDEGTEGVKYDPGSSSFPPLVPIPLSQTAQTTTQAITPSPQATGTVSGCA